MDESIFEINGVTYVSVSDITGNSDGCKQCACNRDFELCLAAPPCLDESRKDGRNVIYREV